MTNSRDKGARAERDLASRLTEMFPSFRFIRGQQRSGAEIADVVAVDDYNNVVHTGVHIEAKHNERLNLQDAMEQSVRDALPSEVPTVFHRKNRSGWLVTIRLQDLIAFTDAILAMNRKTVTVEAANKAEALDILRRLLYYVEHLD